MRKSLEISKPSDSFSVCLSSNRNPLKVRRPRRLWGGYNPAPSPPTNNENLVWEEIFVTAIGLGLLYQSWWVFGLTLIGLVVATQIRPLAAILFLAFSVAWGVIGYAIGKEVLNSDDAGAVLAVLGFLAGLVVHFGRSWRRGGCRWW